MLTKNVRTNGIYMWFLKTALKDADDKTFLFLILLQDDKPIIYEQNQMLYRKNSHFSLSTLRIYCST